MKLIGISGVAGSGKDTVADYLFRQHGFSKIAFADPLKQALVKVLGVNPKYFHESELKDATLPYWGFSPRHAMQSIGESIKNSLGEEVWLKRWFLSYQMIGETDHVVVPDARFDLECAAIRQLGGTIIHLRRPGAGLTGDAARHVSELGPSIMPEDHVLINDGTLEELYAGVEILLNEVAE